MIPPSRSALPRKLKSWESFRVCHRLEDEIRDRTTGQFSEADPLGDPNDIVALKAALEILYAHTER